MEDSISVRTPAKINLTLDIIGRREDGYHFLRSIMQAVSLFDEIEISKNDNGLISIKCENDRVPHDEKNIVCKAIREFFNYFCEELPCGFDVAIEKNIPMLAGLAGGSADAAGTLVALNEMFEKNLTREQLCEIGERVGADVPFCILGATALAEGVGDILTPLPNLPECYIVIAKPDIDISTPEAFKKFDSFDVPLLSKFDDFIAGLTVSNLELLSSLLFNALEVATDSPQINELKQKMLEMDALGVLMSGSGSAVFGIFDKKKTASRCADELEQEYSFVTVCTPFHNGAEIVD